MWLARRVGNPSFDSLLWHPSWRRLCAGLWNTRMPSVVGLCLLQVSGLLSPRLDSALQSLLTPCLTLRTSVPRKKGRPMNLHVRQGTSINPPWESGEKGTTGIAKHRDVILQLLGALEFRISGSKPWLSNFLLVQSGRGAINKNPRSEAASRCILYRTLLWSQPRIPIHRLS